MLASGRPRTPRGGASSSPAPTLLRARGLDRVAQPPVAGDDDDRPPGPGRRAGPRRSRGRRRRGRRGRTRPRSRRAAAATRRCGRPSKTTVSSIALAGRAGRRAAASAPPSRPGRSRHQPSGREPSTFMPSTISRSIAPTVIAARSYGRSDGARRPRPDRRRGARPRAAREIRHRPRIPASIRRVPERETGEVRPPPPRGGPSDREDDDQTSGSMLLRAGEDRLDRGVGAEERDPPAALAQRQPEADQAEVVVLAGGAGEQSRAAAPSAPSPGDARAAGRGAGCWRSAPGRPLPRRSTQRSPSSRRTGRTRLADEGVDAERSRPRGRGFARRRSSLDRAEPPSSAALSRRQRVPGVRRRPAAPGARSGSPASRTRSAASAGASPLSTRRDHRRRRRLVLRRVEAVAGLAPIRADHVVAALPRAQRRGSGCPLAGRARRSGSSPVPPICTNL